MVQIRSERLQRRNSANRARADCGSTVPPQVASATRSTIAIELSYRTASPTLRGRLIRDRLRLCYHWDWFVRFRVFVFGRSLQLIATEIESDHILLFAE